MSSFGTWYDEKRAAESNNGDVELGGAGSSFFSSFAMDSDQVLPLFNSDSLQGFSFESMKQSMEAQMPKKLMGMGYQQRFKVFCALLFLSALFFALAFLIGIPVLPLKPQKFALSFTCGSLTFMASFGILKGPKEHLMSMCAADRMFFTTIYLGSMFLTLYLTCTKGGLKGYVLTVVSSVVQLAALLWYLVSFLPGGTMGLSLVLRAICTMLQPVIAGCMKVQSMCFSACLGYLSRSSA